MSKPRVATLASRVGMSDASRIKPLNPDAWREGLTTAQRGYGGKWQRARLSYLAKHPLCRMCEAKGRVTEATLVDHIKDHRGDMTLFWDSENNWQPLCGPCHSAKTAADGIGSARRG